MWVAPWLFIILFVATMVLVAIGTAWAATRITDWWIKWHPYFDDTFPEEWTEEPPTNPEDLYIS